MCVNFKRCSQKTELRYISGKMVSHKRKKSSSSNFLFKSKTGLVCNLLAVLFLCLFFLNFFSPVPCSLLSQHPLGVAGVAVTKEYGMCNMKN